MTMTELFEHLAHPVTFVGGFIVATTIGYGGVHLVFASEGPSEAMGFAILFGMTTHICGLKPMMWAYRKMEL